MNDYPDSHGRRATEMAQRPRTIGGIAYWVQRLAAEASSPRAAARPSAPPRDAVRIAVHADAEAAAAS